MTDRRKRLEALTRVSGLRERIAESELAWATAAERDAAEQRAGRLAALASAGPVGADAALSGASLAERRMRVELRTQALLAADAALDAARDATAAAQDHWRWVVRQRRSVERLDERLGEEEAMDEQRRAEKALDDLLRSRRGRR